MNLRALPSRSLLRNASIAAGLAGIGLLLVSFLEYGESGKLSLTEKHRASALRQYDSYLIAPSGITYNSDGIAEYSWEADRANRMRNGEITLLNPRYHGLRANQQEWTAEARHGALATDGQRLQLEEQVLVADFIYDSRIRASELTLDIADNSIHSSAPVEFKSQNAITTATGLHANMNSNRLEFLANVKGVYDSP